MTTKVNEKKLWVVGRVIELTTTASGAPRIKVWEMDGVYDDEAKARATCRDFNYFVGRVLLNRPFRYKNLAEWIHLLGVYPYYNPKEQDELRKQAEKKDRRSKGIFKIVDLDGLGKES